MNALEGAVFAAAGLIVYGIGQARGMSRAQEMHRRLDPIREARWLELGRAEGLASKDNPECAEAYLVGISEGVQMERDRVDRERSRRHHPSTPPEGV